MIRQFELDVLNAIGFKTRYLHSKMKYVREPSTKFTLTSPEVKLLIKGMNYYKFKNSGHTYRYDRVFDKWSFRLVLDIKYEIVLTYIYILYDDKFLNTGTIQLGKVFNDHYNDQSYTNEKFGFNSKDEMTEYICLMIEIYEDFVKEYILRLEQMNSDQLSALMKQAG